MLSSQVPPLLKVQSCIIPSDDPNWLNVIGPARILVPGTNGFNKPFAIQEPNAERFKCSTVSITVPFGGILSLTVTSVSTSNTFYLGDSQLSKYQLGPTMIIEGSRKRSVSPDIILDKANKNPVSVMLATSRRTKIEPDDDWDEKDNDPNFISTNPKKVKRRIETAQYLEAKLKLREGYDEIWELWLL